MNPVKEAVGKFTNGHSCSTAILSSFAKKYGFDEKLAIKLASGFGGGMARKADTCGAVTGAIMVIGLHYCNGPDAKEIIYGQVQQFMKIFSERNGSIYCRELLPVNISIEDERNYAEEQNLFQTKCTEFVRDAAGILPELLSE